MSVNVFVDGEERRQFGLGDLLRGLLGESGHRNANAKREKEVGPHGTTLHRRRAVCQLLKVQGFK